MRSASLKVALFLFVGALTEGMPGSRDAVEMRLQRAIGFIGIMAADRVNDRNMLLIANVVMLVQSLISHGWTCGDQPVEQGNVWIAMKEIGLSAISASTRWKSTSERMNAALLSSD